MNIHDIFDSIDYVSNITQHVVIVTTVIVILALELIAMFIARYAIIMKINGIKILKTDSDHIKQKSIIQNHLGYEISIAFLVSLFVIALFNASPQDYIINTMVAPIIGVLTGITIDNVYIIPKRSHSLYATNSIASSNDQASSTKSNDDSHSVTININNNPEGNPDNHDAKSHHTDSSLCHLNYLDESLVESDNFNSAIVDSVNSLIDNNINQYEKIQDLEDKSNKTLDLVSKLQESEMIDKKLKLKSEIYRCLADGYVRPKDHEQICAQYYAYTELLGGNGEIQQLYNNYFTKLSVHEDRRKSAEPVDLERRKANELCKYGQYDSETLNINE